MTTMWSESQAIQEEFISDLSLTLANINDQLMILEICREHKNVIDNVFRSFHSIKGTASFLGLTEITTACHFAESILDRFRKDIAVIREGDFVEIMGITSYLRDINEALKKNEPLPAMSNALTHALQIKGQANEPTIPPSKNYADQLHELFEKTIEPTETESDQHQAITHNYAILNNDIDNYIYRGNEQGSVIRVETHRIDRSLAIASHVLNIQNTLNKLCLKMLEGQREHQIYSDMDTQLIHMTQSVAELQQIIMGLRIQPISSLLNRYPAVVQDIACARGKNVALVIEGGHTGIDKTVLDDLHDPLMHMLRNAIDHGIETPEERIQKGKPAQGILRLSVHQDVCHVVIEVIDDGRGLDLKKIRQQAVEYRVVEADRIDAMTDEEVTLLIFKPGFSTASRVSKFSGRGVGLDVVETNIHRLHGTVRIQSALGHGSRFIMSLPLTLTALPIIMFSVASQQYALPLNKLRDTVTINWDYLQEVNGRLMMFVKNEYLPIIKLTSLLGIKQVDMPTHGLVLEANGTSFVLAVDQNTGTHDAIINGLNKNRPWGVIGVTSRGHNQQTLVLDIAELLGNYETTA